MLARWFISFNILNKGEETFPITPGNVIIERDTDELENPEKFMKLQSEIQETIRKTTSYKNALLIINNFKQLPMPAVESANTEPEVEEV